MVNGLRGRLNAVATFVPHSTSTSPGSRSASNCAAFLRAMLRTHFGQQRSTRSNPRRYVSRSSPITTKQSRPPADCGGAGGGGGRNAQRATGREGEGERGL